MKKTSIRLPFLQDLGIKVTTIGFQQIYTWVWLLLCLEVAFIPTFQQMENLPFIFPTDLTKKGYSNTSIPKNFIIHKHSIFLQLFKNISKRFSYSNFCVSLHGNLFIDLVFNAL